MLLSKEQQNSIVSYLKENFKLPEKGIVAGQAVASLAYRELGMDIPFFINDVDVFTTEGNRINSDLKPFNVANLLNSYNDSGSDLFLSQNKLRSYKIIHSKISEDDNNVNIIQVKVSNSRYTLENNKNILIKEIINSFDLNCCCIGFNLETLEFLTMQSFDDFCQSKQLRINSAHTPYHSSLRIIKKMEELSNVYCNVKQEIACLFYKEYKQSESILIGQKFILMYDKYANDEIREIFSYDNSKCSGEQINLGLSRVRKDIKKIEEFYKKYNFSHYDYSNVAINLSANSIVHDFHLNNNTGLFNKKYKESIKYIEKTSLLEILLLKNDMVQSPLTQIDLKYKKSKEKQIIKMLIKHPNILSYLNNKKTPETLSILKKIYTHADCKLDKKFIIGLIETGKLPFDDIEEVLEMNREQGMKKLFSHYDFNTKVNKIKNINLPFIKINSLLQVVDFVEEGCKQRNCILGYYDIAKTKSSAEFYSIRFLNENISVYIDNGNIYQYYGIQNKGLDSFRHKILKCVLEYIYKKEIKTPVKIYFNYEIRMLQYKWKSFKNKFNKKSALSKRDESSKFNPYIDFDDDIPF